MSRILSYRGFLASGGQERILLSTRKGEVGYRIIKFQLMPEKPGTTDYEHIAKLWKVSQSTIDESIDFSDNRLLGAAFTEGGAATNFIGNPLTVIFDREIFNQDIYITQIDTKSTLACNYYLELETIKLSEHDAMVTTIQSIRNG
jgi:hypothetical protein